MSFARLIILDLLSIGHASCVQLIGATELVQLLAALFPAQQESPYRELFISGPHRDVRALINRAVSGWLSALSGEVLAGRLVQVSCTCERALRFRAACSVCYICIRLYMYTPIYVYAYTTQVSEHLCNTGI